MMAAAPHTLTPHSAATPYASAPPSHPTPLHSHTSCPPAPIRRWHSTQPLRGCSVNAIAPDAPPQPQHQQPITLAPPNELELAAAAGSYISTALSTDLHISPGSNQPQQQWELWPRPNRGHTNYLNHLPDDSLPQQQTLPVVAPQQDPGAFSVTETRDNTANSLNGTPGMTPWGRGTNKTQVKSQNSFTSKTGMMTQNDNPTDQTSSRPSHTAKAESPQGMDMAARRQQKQRSRAQQHQMAHGQDAPSHQGQATRPAWPWLPSTENAARGPPIRLPTSPPPVTSRVTCTGVDTRQSKVGKSPANTIRSKLLTLDEQERELTHRISCCNTLSSLRHVMQLPSTTSTTSCTTIRSAMPQSHSYPVSAQATSTPTPSTSSSSTMSVDASQPGPLPFTDIHFSALVVRLKQLLAEANAHAAKPTLAAGMDTHADTNDPWRTCSQQPSAQRGAAKRTPEPLSCASAGLLLEEVVSAYPRSISDARPRPAAVALWATAHARLSLRADITIRLMDAVVVGAGRPLQNGGGVRGQGKEESKRERPSKGNEPLTPADLSNAIWGASRVCPDLLAKRLSGLTPGLLACLHNMTSVQLTATIWGVSCTGASIPPSLSEAFTEELWRRDVSSFSPREVITLLTGFSRWTLLAHDSAGTRFTPSPTSSLSANTPRISASTSTTPASLRTYHNTTQSWTGLREPPEAPVAPGVQRTFAKLLWSPRLLGAKGGSTGQVAVSAVWLLSACIKGRPLTGKLQRQLLHLVALGADYLGPEPVSVCLDALARLHRMSKPLPTTRRPFSASSHPSSSPSTSAVPADASPSSSHPPDRPGPGTEKRVGRQQWDDTLAALLAQLTRLLPEPAQQQPDLTVLTEPERHAGAEQAQSSSYSRKDIQATCVFTGRHLALVLPALAGIKAPVGQGLRNRLALAVKHVARHPGDTDSTQLLNIMISSSALKLPITTTTASHLMNHCMALLKPVNNSPRIIPATQQQQQQRIQQQQPSQQQQQDHKQLQQQVALVQAQSAAQQLLTISQLLMAAMHFKLQLSRQQQLHLRSMLTAALAAMVPFSRLVASHAQGPIIMPHLGHQPQALARTYGSVRASVHMPYHHPAPELCGAASTILWASPHVIKILTPSQVTMLMQLATWGHAGHLAPTPAAWQSLLDLVGKLPASGTTDQPPQPLAMPPVKTLIKAGQPDPLIVNSLTSNQVTHLLLGLAAHKPRPVRTWLPRVLLLIQNHQVMKQLGGVAVSVALNALATALGVPTTGPSASHNQPRIPLALPTSKSHSVAETTSAGRGRVVDRTKGMPSVRLRQNQAIQRAGAACRYAAVLRRHRASRLLRRMPGATRMLLDRCHGLRTPARLLSAFIRLGEVPGPAWFRTMTMAVARGLTDAATAQTLAADGPDAVATNRKLACEVLDLANALLAAREQLRVRLQACRMRPAMLDRTANVSALGTMNGQPNVVMPKDLVRNASCSCIGIDKAVEAEPQPAVQASRSLIAPQLVSKPVKPKASSTWAHQTAAAQAPKAQVPSPKVKPHWAVYADAMHALNFMCVRFSARVKVYGGEVSRVAKGGQPASKAAAGDEVIALNMGGVKDGAILATLLNRRLQQLSQVGRN